MERKYVYELKCLQCDHTIPVPEDIANFLFQHDVSLEFTEKSHWTCPTCGKTDDKTRKIVYENIKRSYGDTHSKQEPPQNSGQEPPQN